MRERLKLRQGIPEGEPLGAPVPGAPPTVSPDEESHFPVDGFPACRLVLAARMTSRLRGLLMSPASDAILLLAPCRDIHTFGMGYAIDVAFVDETGRVLESRRDVMPNRRLRNARASAVLERYAIPHEVWFEAGDRLQIESYRHVQNSPESSRKEDL
jgi:uncharacterized membrane protein (UPF0127 family)